VKAATLKLLAISVSDLYDEVRDARNLLDCSHPGDPVDNRIKATDKLASALKKIEAVHDVLFEGAE
jgi:hypothetical protein